MIQGGPSWNIFMLPKDGFSRVDLMQVILTQGDSLCFVFKFAKEFDCSIFNVI